jgi:hypothetical protein
MIVTTDRNDFIADLISSASVTIQDAVQRAYARGLSDGRRLASEHLKERLAMVLTESLAPTSDTTSPRSPLVESPGQNQLARAPRGSVEPAILDALRNAPTGKKPSEIAVEKNIPENSVRGKLNLLRSQQRVHKVREHWYITGSIPPKAEVETPAS